MIVFTASKSVNAPAWFVLRVPTAGRCSAVRGQGGSTSPHVVNICHSRYNVVRIPESNEKREDNDMR